MIIQKQADSIPVQVSLAILVGLRTVQFEGSILNFYGSDHCMHSVQKGEIW